MKLIKVGLLVVLVVVLAGTGLSVASVRGMIKTPPWIAYIPKKLPTLPRPTLPPEAEKQVSILSERSKVLGAHVGTVLGSYIQARETKEPIHQRTLEYARFIYCQQVVTDYQAQSSSPAASVQ